MKQADSTTWQMARLDDRQREHEIEVIVGGDAAVALEAAAEAAVHDHVLALRPREGADGCHGAVAVAGAISRGTGVDMT